MWTNLLMKHVSVFYTSWLCSVIMDVIIPASATSVIVLTLWVLVWVCVTTLRTEQTDTWTSISASRSSGRISRSSSKVKVVRQRSRSPGQNNVFRGCQWWMKLEISDGAAKEGTMYIYNYILYSYDAGCFQSVCVLMWIYFIMNICIFMLQFIAMVVHGIWRIPIGDNECFVWQG